MIDNRVRLRLARYVLTALLKVVAFAGCAVAVVYGWSRVLWAVHDHWGLRWVDLIGISAVGAIALVATSAVLYEPLMGGWDWLRERAIREIETEEKVTASGSGTLLRAAGEPGQKGDEA